MMRLIAVACNCVLFSAVVTGCLPQLCPSKISERNGRDRIEHPAQSAGDLGLDLPELHQAGPCRVARATVMSGVEGPHAWGCR
jgi:hypothetical protein